MLLVKNIKFNAISGFFFQITYSDGITDAEENQKNDCFATAKYKFLSIIFPFNQVICEN
jgi:hypothetical protein